MVAAVSTEAAVEEVSTAEAPRVAVITVAAAMAVVVPRQAALDRPADMVAADIAAGRRLQAIEVRTVLTPAAEITALLAVHMGTTVGPAQDRPPARISAGRLSLTATGMDSETLVPEHRLRRGASATPAPSAEIRAQLETGTPSAGRLPHEAAHRRT